MTIRDRIIDYLRKNPDGIDDDALADQMQLGYRQQANARCRELEKDGLVRRRLVRGKIHNFWIGGQLLTAVVDDNMHPSTSTLIDSSKPWFWEGNIQATVVNFLVVTGYSIVSVANTSTRQPGTDIVAIRGKAPVWVTVKGYPEGTPKTHASTQAGHWFKQAVFDIIEFREESSLAELFLAVPERKRYRSLASKIAWLEDAARFRYLWVNEDGSVRSELQP